MQSLLSCSHGRRALNFGEIPGSFFLNSPQRAKLSVPEQLCFPSTKPTSSSSSSSSSSPSLQCSLRSRYHFLPKTKNQRRNETSRLRCGISSNSYSANGRRSLRDWIEAIGEAVSTAFPIWVALGCLLGLVKPASYNWVKPEWTVLGITLTMLGMGMTLTFDDLRGALAMPKELLAGFVLQYSVSSVFVEESCVTFITIFFQYVMIQKVCF